VFLGFVIYLGYHILQYIERCIFVIIQFVAAYANNILLRTLVAKNLGARKQTLTVKFQLS
jgi:hypothetical protein